MNKVLITGGTGFLGSYLTQRLLNEGKSVTISTTSIKQKNTLSVLGITEKVNLVKGDVRDFEFLRMLFNEYEFDSIFHLGAISEVRKCQTDAKLAFDTNVGGTINVLEAARLYGNIKSIVVSSSDKAYGKGDRLPYLENDRLNGTATYEVSKSCADLIARSYYHNYGLPVVVTRCSNLYGGGDMNLSRIIPNTIRRIMNNKSPIIWEGSEKSIREFLYIEDAVNAYMSLTNNINVSQGKAYNIGSNEKITIGELVNTIIKAMDSKIKIDYRSKDFPEISHQYLDSSKIINELGWEPKTTMIEGLIKTIQIYKEM